VRDGGHVGAELVHGLAELGFAGGVVEQQPEPGRIGGGGLQQPGDAGLGELIAAGGGDQPAAGAVQDGLVQVGLGVEVPVEDGPADAGFGGDVIEVGRGEPGPGERAGGRGDDLFPALDAG
jgi:hypothetical protein